MVEHEDEDGDITDRVNRMVAKQPRDHLARAIALADSMNSDHINIEEEREELRRRERVRHERARKLLDSLPAGVEYNEETMVEEFRKAGALDGVENDYAIAATLRYLELGRQHRN
jgi:hypothetical protein